jgi:hypothetical protein
MTDIERKRLLLLPCVVKDCKNKQHQIEHFPPRRFLQSLDVITNRYFVWSICRKHNRQMADFIKKMPTEIRVVPRKLHLAKDTDPLRMYKASANRAILRFYSAIDNDDMERAILAVERALGLWVVVNDMKSVRKPSSTRQRRNKRKMKGKRPYSPEGSQLPMRDD